MPTPVVSPTSTAHDRSENAASTPVTKIMAKPGSSRGNSIRPRTDALTWNESKR